MKKSRIVVSLIIIAAILCVAFWVHSYHEKKNAERMHELDEEVPVTGNVIGIWKEFVQ